MNKTSIVFIFKTLSRIKYSTDIANTKNFFVNNVYQVLFIKPDSI